MLDDDARAFARAWIEAWNAHDVEAVLSHFADDVFFTSPLAARLHAGSDGAVQGKEAVRAYWNEGLRLNPELHFELLGVYSGVETIVIHFRNRDGGQRCEVMTFEGGLVRVGHATDLVGPVGHAEP